MRLEILGDITDQSSDEIFIVYLRRAKYVYLGLVYPYQPDIEDLPNDRARNWQTRCAIEINNLGGDFRVVSYAENGLQEVYSKAGLSKDLLNDLPPANAGVPK